MIPDDHSLEVRQPRSHLGETSAYGDQTSSNHDQTCSDRDQVAADRDQAASDQDQAANDLARDLGRDGYDSNRATHEQTAQARQETAYERHHTAQLRETTARERDEAAARRDRAAEAYDHQADEVDAAIARWTAGLESEQPTNEAQITLQAPRARQLAADAPGRSPAQRGEAARDRAEAARDRLSAAQDRARAATEREGGRVREPTDPERRGSGLAAVQREIDRARRQKGVLVVAYVDFGRSEATNDIDDQDVGGERVKQLVGVIKAHLRPDELIVRLGGEEFLCALPGATIENLGGRAEQLAGQLTATPYVKRVNIGVAELVLDDNAIDLVERAHAHAGLLAVGGDDRHGQQQNKS
jgi:GGDEF domain-containing protein